MLTFFRGWRRNLGVVTLMMTCVFAAGWVRSSYVEDDVTLQWWFRLRILKSADGVLHFRSAFIESGSPVLKWSSTSNRPFGDYRFPTWGFFGAVKLLDYRQLDVQYPLLVVPLTLLSTYLLLGKPPETTIPPNDAQVTHA